MKNIILLILLIMSYSFVTINFYEVLSPSSIEIKKNELLALEMTLIDHEKFHEKAVDIFKHSNVEFEYHMLLNKKSQSLDIKQLKTELLNKKVYNNKEHLIIQTSFVSNYKNSVKTLHDIETKFPYSIITEYNIRKTKNSKDLTNIITIHF